MVHHRSRCCFARGAEIPLSNGRSARTATRRRSTELPHASASTLNLTTCRLSFGRKRSVLLSPPVDQAHPRCHWLRIVSRMPAACSASWKLARCAATSPAQVRAAESGAISSLDTLEILSHWPQVSPTWLSCGTVPRELPDYRGGRSAEPASVK